MKIAVAKRSVGALWRIRRELGHYATPIVLGTVAFILIMMAVWPGLFTSQSPYKVVPPERLLPPFWSEGGSMAHPLGTDDIGRDIWSRIVYGARVSLEVAALAIFVGCSVGTLLGLISGYYGGKMDIVIMRTADVMLSLPLILVALLLAVTLGPSLWNIVIAISAVLWARYARIIRAEVLSLKEREFVLAAKVAGASRARIIMRHLFPNVVNTMAVLVSLQVGWVVIVEASLSFLGAGVPPPTPAWGSMTAAGRDYVDTAWWFSTFPGFFIMLTVLAFNILGDWLRDTLDPKLRRARV